MGSGEKHVSGDDLGGGNSGSRLLNKDAGELGTDVGFSDANLEALEVCFDGSVALLLRTGFDTCSGGNHPGAGVLRVKDDVRDGASPAADVAAVEGRDDATLTNDDRLDATVDASDG